MTQLQFHTALIGQQKRLLYYAMKLTSDMDNAQDLLQETLLKALVYNDKFTQNTNFKAWVYIIMKNTYINNYRQNKRAVNIFSTTNNDFLNFDQNKGNPSPESIYNSKEIIKCIDALEAAHRIPFNMFIEGFKYIEIAEELHLPIGTIKSRIFFARQKLGTSLKDYK